MVPPSSSHFLAYVKLCVVSSFIIRLPYMHPKHFDHSPIYYFLLSPLFPLPLSSFTSLIVVVSFYFHDLDFLGSFLCFSCLLQMRKNMWYLSLWDWLSSLNTIISCSMHFPANYNFILLNGWVKLRLYISHFLVHSSTDAQLGWFYNLIIMKSAVINMGIYISLW
jgi:hypothetical protein